MVGEFLPKRKKSFFSAVQNDKPEINILQKEWEETFFTFQDTEKTIVQSH